MEDIELKDLPGVGEKTAEKLIEKAAKEGVTIEKTYKVFIIYDREVEIDPFYAH